MNKSLTGSLLLLCAASTHAVGDCQTEIAKAQVTDYTINVLFCLDARITEIEDNHKREIDALRKKVIALETKRDANSNK